MGRRELNIIKAMGFSGSSGGKESACNAGDPGSIPGLGRSPGEGIGYPLQYFQHSCGSQAVARQVKSSRIGNFLVIQGTG